MPMSKYRKRLPPIPGDAPILSGPTMPPPANAQGRSAATPTMMPMPMMAPPPAPPEEEKSNPFGGGGSPFGNMMMMQQLMGGGPAGAAGAGEAGMTMNQNIPQWLRKMLGMAMFPEVPPVDLPPSSPGMMSETGAFGGMDDYRSFGGLGNFGGLSRYW